MALGFAVGLRNTNNNAITTRAGNAALLRVYNGTRPATGGAVTTLLVELVCGSPFAPGSAAGVLSPTLPGNGTGVAAGTATWFRLINADGTTIVFDGSVGATGSGADLILDNTTIAVGQTVSVTAWTHTAGNP